MARSFETTTRALRLNHGVPPEGIAKKRMDRPTDRDGVTSTVEALDSEVTKRSGRRGRVLP